MASTGSMMSRSLAAAAILLLAVVHQVGAQSTTLLNSPSEYFGGSNAENDVYLTWADSRALTYDSSIFMPSAADPAVGAAVHWSLIDDSIYLAVAVRATGWVGFGLSENGGMQGADVILFKANTPDELVDAYILDERLPIADDCQSWNFTSSQTDDGFLIFEAVRLLDTGDPQDRVILDDASRMIASTRIIAAWGDAPEVGYHGTNRARAAVRWFDNLDEQEIFTRTMEQNAAGSFKIGASDHPINAVDTAYVKFCASHQDILAQGVPTIDKMSIIGFEPIVSASSAPFVHHFTVRASQGENNGYSATCGGTFPTTIELAYAWAPGEGPFALPSNIGAPYGGLDGFKSFVLEIHYNNPDMVQGLIDSSGVRFYYTTEPREIEIGILTLGDPLMGLRGQALGNGLSSHSFRCPGSCSSTALQQPVTVLREYLHMHQTGKSMVNEQIRDGEIIRTSAIDFFNFDQQGNQAVQQDPFEVLPGDSFNTVCYYQSQDGNSVFVHEFRLLLPPSSSLQRIAVDLRIQLGHQRVRRRMDRA